MPINDNAALSVGHGTFSDAHGHAALLLVESLMHGLCENRTLTSAEAIEITERAVEVQGEQAEAADGAGAPLWQAHALLSAIAASLRSDGGGARPPLSPVT